MNDVTISVAARVVCSSLSHLPACSSVSSFVSVISRSRSVISVPFVSIFFSETRTNNRVARANRIDVIAKMSGSRREQRKTSGRRL